MGFHSRRCINETLTLLSFSSIGGKKWYLEEFHENYDDLQEVLCDSRVEQDTIVRFLDLRCYIPMQVGKKCAPTI